MNDITSINHSINNVMDKYIRDNNYFDNVVFESRIMFSCNSVMFTLMMKTGILKVEPFKAVFPLSFLSACEEDQIVKMVCDMFKGVVDQCMKLAIEEEYKEDVTVRFTN